MFNSIVVAFDGSPHANRALEIGSELAARDKATLNIIYVIDKSHLHVPEAIREMGETEHVIDPMPKVQVNYENAPTSMMSALAQANADSLDAMFQYADFIVGQAESGARHAGAAKVDSKVAQGDPAEEIITFAKNRKADLIVCGSRGLGKWKSMLLGSISSKLVQLSTCSCLTVK
ncbi:MAG TPA: universal stress protein [Gammaproteobacteria bacterium]|nr:universal stress protein [Gammaproteobacteria bacterium]